MHVAGSFKLGVVDIPHTLGRELHFSFTNDFRAKSTADQVADLRPYIHELNILTTTLPRDDGDLRGLLTVVQVAERPLPHFEQDEIPLEDTIIIEIKPDFAAGFLNIEGLASH